MTDPRLCPLCKGKTKVTHLTKRKNLTIRYRECKQCKFRYHTKEEIIEFHSIAAVK